MTIETRPVVLYVVWVVVVAPIALLIFSYEPNALYVVVPLILVAANGYLRRFLTCPKRGMTVIDTLVIGLAVKFFCLADFDRSGVCESAFNE
jgi:uncharacterized membrane protein